MTLDEGASFEINSRWPEYRQRNCALDNMMYGKEYYINMLAGIKLIRDHHDSLKDKGVTTWECPSDLSLLLDDLAQKSPAISFMNPQ